MEDQLRPPGYRNRYPTVKYSDLVDRTVTKEISQAQQGCPMVYSIRTLIFATLIVAITCANASFAANGYAWYLTWAFASLVITTSLASPLVCRRSARPFWAAYSTTAAYTLISRGTEYDPFFLASQSVAALLFGNVDFSHGGYASRLYVAATMMWTPAMFGLLSGILMVTALWLLAPAQPDG